MVHRSSFRKKFRGLIGKEVEDDLALVATTWSNPSTSGFPHGWDSLKSLRVLLHSVDVVRDKTDVLYDSGLRNGTDILKALVLGAKMVFIGRPYVYGVALEGEAGVRHVLRSLLGEADLILNLMGSSSVEQSELNRACLSRIKE
ncbi:FMN-linked oxidoreductase [Acephala macrosclerotiorum]|nr:FMN-linked oxidoreductase [Acephala macrosclerotiorum]